VTDRYDLRRLQPYLEQAMTASVAVLGATGVYGRHLVPRLVAAGHRVRALVRRPEAAAALAAAGVDVRAADIFDGASLRSALAGCDTAINLATALPSPTKSGDFDLNDRIRREGVPVFLAACEAAGVGRIIQQSIAMVHAGGADAWANEDSFFSIPRDNIAGRAIAAANDMEAAVRATSLDWALLRGALFYGPGTGFDDDCFARAQAGNLRLPGDGEDYVTLVHVADMAAATVAALQRWPSGQALIIADDAPTRWRELFAYIATAAGGAAPQAGGPPRLPSFRLRNHRAREALGWAPRFGDFRAGLAR
jgi:nucleoside-diphosphate-sugar epimerase